MGLRETLVKGKFAITVELGPPKGTNVEPLLKSARALKGLVDAANVTDCQSSIMRASSLAICHLLAKEGVEPVFQITCRDRNRLALQSDLLGAGILGIRNLLILGGDNPAQGDHPETKAVFDLDTMALLRAARTLRSGKDLSGNALEGAPDFWIGAAADPGAKNQEVEISKLRAKIENGAEFFQTQGVYEPEKFQVYAQAAKPLGAKLLAGIIVVKSAKQARFMNEKIPGIHVPEPMIEEIDRAQDKKQTAIDQCARIIRGVRPFAAGVHLMMLGWEEIIPQVLEKSGVLETTKR